MVAQANRFNEMNQQFREAMERPAEVVREYPLASMLLMFGMGLGVGVVLSHTIAHSLSEMTDLEPTMTEKMRQQVYGALSNVLLNAVDASPENGRITVTARLVKMAGRDAVKVSVADNGKGIAPENLETIWEPYVTNKPGGTGLGLAIARQAVWAHDGTVTATSALGKGTEIQFTIPANGAGAVRTD